MSSEPSQWFMRKLTPPQNASWRFSLFAEGLCTSAVLAGATLALDSANSHNFQVQVFCNCRERCLSKSFLPSARSESMDRDSRSRISTALAVKMSASVASVCWWSVLRKRSQRRHSSLLVTLKGEQLSALVFLLPTLSTCGSLRLTTSEQR